MNANSRANHQKKRQLIRPKGSRPSNGGGGEYWTWGPNHFLPVGCLAALRLSEQRRPKYISRVLEMLHSSRSVTYTYTHTQACMHWVLAEGFQASCRTCGSQQFVTQLSLYFYASVRWLFIACWQLQRCNVDGNFFPIFYLVFLFLHKNMWQKWTVLWVRHYKIPVLSLKVTRISDCCFFWQQPLKAHVINCVRNF